MKYLRQNYINLRNILRYSDTELLEFIMNIVLAVINPLIFYNTVVNCPMWLVLLGIPFGLYSIYKVLNKCSEGRSLSYTLTIGQLLGILILVHDMKSLVYPFAFQLLVFIFLKWRASKDVFRFNRRNAKC